MVVVKGTMAKARLSELYPVATPVEIMLGGSGWLAGRVEQHQHPGIWVRDENGRSWFVTNRSHIRLLSTDANGKIDDES
jgi:hypothetical protein